MRSIQVTSAGLARRSGYEEVAREDVDQSCDARSERAKRDSAILSGMEITGVTFTDSLVRFKLSGPLGLEVFPAGIDSDWRILPAVAPDNAPDGGGTEEDTILLEFVTPQATHRSQIWNRKSLLDARIGRRITRLWASETPLLLFVEGIPGSLYFLPLWKLPEGPLVLQWHDEL